MSLSKINKSKSKANHMENSTYCERENARIQKLYKFQLPHRYKKVGYLVTALFVVFIFTRKIMEYDGELLKTIIKNGFLLGLLIISISKEKVEDELIESLRTKSYRIAFVLTVAYAVVQPLIEYVVETVIKGEASLGDFSYFQVLVFMLIVQIGFFEQLKRYFK